jgi:nucleotide-binding universal stress UspA family protein
MMTMFHNILVPLDGSGLSEASLGAALVLAKKLGSTVTLLHVIEQGAPAEVHKERHLTRSDEAEAYLKEAAARAFPPPIRVLTHVHAAPVADVARSIAEHATTELKPDLIVVCTHGRGGVHDLLFGSIAQQIVAQGTIPLLLIKPDSPTFQIRTMLVPLDQDSAHDDGLPPAEMLAQAFDAELKLVSIIPTYATLTGEQGATSSLMPATTQAMLDLREEHARDHLQLHLEALNRLGIRCSATVGRGDPAAAILRSAEQTGIDLIILSTHRKSGLGAFWSRSVAPSIAQRTRVPLLLLPLS